MNTQVTATGMSVTANVPESLQISKTSSTTGFGSTVVLENDTTSGFKSTLASDGKIEPVAHNATTTSTALPTFYKLTSAAKASVSETGVLTGDFASKALTSTDTYTTTTADYFVDQVWLRLDGASNTTKQVNVKVDWSAAPSADAIKNALHVLFVGKDGKVLCDWDMGDSGTFSATPNTTAKVLTGLTLTTGSPATESVAAVDATVETVYAYAYLAGNDNECFNANISAADIFQLTITFGVQEVAAS